MPNAATETLPAGFRRTSESGLIVPAEVSREREVWSRNEWKILERATKLLQARDIQIFFRCNRKACQSAPIQRVRRPDGGISLECDHKTREFQVSR